jgi:hypothetical protein
MLTAVPSNDRAMTATIELDEIESKTLREILDRYLRDLNYEIADTDRSAYKDEIKQHREVVRKIANKLP